jgi:two-component system, OmpR family, sensor histidine kinase VicK
MNTPLRLLIVEDSQDDTVLLLHRLRKAGYDLTHQRVDNAADMAMALDTQTWDVVIADYCMPQFTAIAALESVQSRGLDIPFIVVSGVMGEDTAVTIMKAGAHDYLLKDHLSRLVPAVERELREVEIRRGKRQAEAALLHAYEGLEQLVQQRTAELKAANQSLHQLAAIVASSEDAIISVSPEGTVLSWNLGAEQMYGYSATEAQGQPLYRLVKQFASSAEQPAFYQVIQGSDAQARITHQQTLHQRKDGKWIDVFLTLSPVKDDQGEVTGSSLIVRDISALEKMKDEFVAVVSHELRTPLTSIRASLGLLLSGKLGELPPAGKQFVEIAVNNSDRLVRLINDILDLQRLDAGKMTLVKHPCDLADLMQHAVEIMQGMADEAGVSLYVFPLTVTVVVDPDRMLQTLTNLLSNAIKFSSPGSPVWLSAEIKPAGASPIGHSPTPAHVLITVQDHGRGIPADQVESIFGRFQQVDASDSRQQGGTGLGLAICRSIVLQHGGKIWVESKVGEGSKFLIKLPLEAEV